MHRSLLPVALVTARQHGLVTRDQARTAGISRTTIQRLLTERVLIVVHPGVYRPAGMPVTWRQRVLAAVLAAGEGAAASHRSAGGLWELTEADDLVEITVPLPRRPKLRGVVVHRSKDIERATLTVKDGIPVTNPLRTLVDLAAVVLPPVAEDALDRGLHTRLFSFLAVEAELDRLSRRGRNGVGVLRRVLDERALGRDRPDGLLEPRMARLLRKHDLPPAEFQHTVRDEDDRFVARVDFAYPEHRIAIEVEGYEHHSSRRAVQRDAERQTRLAALGWIVLRFTWHDVVRRPGWVADQVRSVLRVSTTTCRS